MTYFTLTHFDSIHIHPFCYTPRFEKHIYMFLAQSYNIDCTCLHTILYSVDYHVSTIHFITARISCPNCQCIPLTFILQLPNSSVRCNCASHQPDLGLLNCPPQAFILLQYRDYHVLTAPKHSFYYNSSQHVQSVSKALILITCFCMSGLSAD